MLQGSNIFTILLRLSPPLSASEVGAQTKRLVRFRLRLMQGDISVRMRLPLRFAQRLKSQGMYSIFSPSGSCSQNSRKLSSLRS